MMPWYYGDGFAVEKTIGGSVMYFLERGFPVVGVAGKIPLNQIAWGETLLPLSRRYPVEGFVYTMWDAGNQDSPRGVGYRAYAQMVWSPDRLYAPALTALERLMRMAPPSPPASFDAQVTPLLSRARNEYGRLVAWFPLEALGINGLDRLEKALETAGALTLE